jgi:histidine triad (HIT) family protein
MKNCVFCKIRDGEIEKKFIYEDKYIMVFPDLNPMRPVHLLIVLKEHVKDLADLSNKNAWNDALEVIKKVVKNNKLTNKGYRVTVNGGGAQIIDHLHIHVSGPIAKDLKI